MTRTDVRSRGAIVLAGGRSSRFGADKLAASVDGLPMLDRAVVAAAAVAAQVVVVVAPHDARSVPDGALIVHDPQGYEGPLAGLRTGLVALGASIDRVIVVGGDMPTLVPAVLARLLDALDDPTADAAVLAVAGRTAPLPLALRRDVGQDAAARLLATGERRLRAVPDTVRSVTIASAVWRIDDPDGASLRDVDTPDDLPTSGDRA